MKRLLLVFITAAALSPAPAGANGRRPTATDVHFHPQDDNWIWGAMTFGVLVSKDDGENFYWICEDAACPGEDGFNGCDTFDPVYVINDAGDIFNTTIFGMYVSRDGGCSFAPVGGPLEGRFTGDIELDADGNVWAVTSDGSMPNDVYFSSNDGQTFATRNLHIDLGWFDNIRAAPSNAQRVYVSGWVPPQDDGMGGFTEAETLLYRTNDGGATWSPVTPSGIPPGEKLLLEVISPSDPDLLLARSPNFDADPIADDIYRSADGGDTWTNVLSLSIETFNMTDPPGIARITALQDGSFLAGSPAGGLLRSTDGGITWNPTAVQPRTWCVRQRGDGTIFACSENWDPDMDLDPSVRAALVKSTDGGDSWQHVVRFSDIAGPLECPPDTAQAQICATERWCVLAAMFGIDTGPECAETNVDAGPIDPDAGPDTPPPDDDCGDCGCSVAFASIFLVLPPGWPRRRRRRGRC